MSTLAVTATLISTCGMRQRNNLISPLNLDTACDSLDVVLISACECVSHVFALIGLDVGTKT